jgi:hypothetical protein
MDASTYNKIVKGLPERCKMPSGAKITKHKGQLAITLPGQVTTQFGLTHHTGYVVYCRQFGDYVVKLQTRVIETGTTYIEGAGGPEVAAAVFTELAACGLKLRAKAKK